MKGLFRTILGTLILVFISVDPGSAQSVHLPKSIIIQKHDSFGMVTNYTVKPKNTLYSICKTFHTKPEILKEANPNLQLYALNPGDSLIIPINSEIIDVVEINKSHDNYIPIYYQTAKKDNIFRIARIYFNQNMDHLMSRNNTS